MVQSIAIGSSVAGVPVWANEIVAEFVPGAEEKHDYESWESWQCTSCHGHFIDADEHPKLLRVPKRLLLIKEENTGFFTGVEPQMYWLGHNELLCSGCAVPRGIPPTL